MSAFNGSASLTYMWSSENSSTDNDLYDAEDDVAFNYVVNDTEYVCDNSGRCIKQIHRLCWGKIYA